MEPEPYSLGVRFAFETNGGELAAHIADTTTHGTTGNIVGTNDSQELTNKTINSAANILTVNGSNINDLLNQSVKTSADVVFGNVNTKGLTIASPGNGGFLKFDAIEPVSSISQFLVLTTGSTTTAAAFSRATFSPAVVSWNRPIEVTQSLTSQYQNSLIVKFPAPITQNDITAAPLQIINRLQDVPGPIAKIQQLFAGLLDGVPTIFILSLWQGSQNLNMAVETMSSSMFNPGQTIEVANAIVVTYSI